MVLKTEVEQNATRYVFDSPVTFYYNSPHNFNLLTKNSPYSISAKVMSNKLRKCYGMRYKWLWWEEEEMTGFVKQRGLPLSNQTHCKVQAGLACYVERNQNQQQLPHI